MTQHIGHPPCFHLSGINIAQEIQNNFIVLLAARDLHQTQTLIAEVFLGTEVELADKLRSIATGICRKDNGR